MVDNVIVQDAIERVLQTCMRLIAIFHLLLEDEDEGGDEDNQHSRPDSDTNIIPLLEVDALKKDFFSHISYLLQIMRKVENRGFMFRIDFNGFLSRVAMESNSNGRL